MPKTACLLAVLLLAAAPAPAQRVLFVDAGATGAGDGATWSDAFPRLQDALAAARPGDEFWVAEGVYRPDRGAGIAPGDRTAYFDLRSGIALYGGFGGTETRRDERDWTAHETILSGDLAGDDGDVLDPFDPTRADNAFHVVGAGDAARGPASATAILDGFTVTGGNANALGIDPNNTGGGFCIILESRPTLRHLVVTRNTARFGGGMGLVSLAAPALEDVVFRENAASEKGGGAWSFVSRPTMRGVRFERNRSDGRGGGLFNEGSAALIDDAVFIGNAAGLDGGGIASERDNSVLTNARVLGNTAPRWGGGMFNVRSAPILMNVVFSGNASTEAGTGDFLGAHGGGGLYNLLGNSNGGPYLTNLVVAGNTAVDGGGGIRNASVDPRLFNSILWGNRTDGEGAQMLNGGVSGSAPVVANSLFEGGLPEGSQNGGAILDADPLFADAAGPDGTSGTDDDDLRLLAASPAIDAGENLALLFDLLDLDGDGDTGERVPVDLDGRQRVFDAGGGPVVDLGAYEFGAPPVLPTAAEAPAEAPPDAPAVLAAFPNPFREHATVRYVLPRAGAVRVQVFDALGRAVATLAEGVRPAGVHEAPLDGAPLASGLYLVRVTAGGAAATQTLLRVR